MMSTVEPGMEVMLETFIHETETMLEQLDEILLDSERAQSLSEENINNIFRITHTIKGSAAMMSFGSISELAHSMEDVFYVIREDPAKLDMVSDTLFDLVLASSDFLKGEVEKLSQQENYQEGEPAALIAQLHKLAATLTGSAAPAGEAAEAQGGDEALTDPDLTHIRVFSRMTARWRMSGRSCC